MSLTALALRLATIRALQGRTWAEGRVYDSRFEAINAISDNSPTPFIVVTTDDDDEKVEGKDILASDHKLELVIEIAAATRVTIENADPTETIVIPHTDAGLEVTLNLVSWQIRRALAADGGPWGDLWRTIVTSVRSIKSRRGADDTKGIRFAARQFVFELDHIAEPIPGGAPAPGDAWTRILTMLKADSEFAAIGRVAEAAIVSDALLPWQRARAALGLADDAATIFADRPLVDDSEPAPVNVEIALTDGFTIDAARADEIDGPEPAP